MDSGKKNYKKEHKDDLSYVQHRDAMNFLNKVHKNRDVLVALLFVAVGGVFVFKRAYRNIESERPTSQKIEARMAALLSHRLTMTDSNFKKQFLALRQKLSKLRRRARVKKDVYKKLNNS